MKTIKIKSINILNFKGNNIKAEFNSDNITIKGENKQGKTTIKKAWLWLLTGFTDANYVANHELFDNTQKLTPDTPIASVEAEITVDDTEYKLRRTAKAKFTRPRGSEEYEKAKSDEYTIYVDDIEFTATRFKDWVSCAICDRVDYLPYLMDGQFFINLSFDDKEKAIKVIHELVGEIKNEDFGGNYVTLFKKLEKYTIDDLKSQCKTHMKPINDRLKVLPSLIVDKEKELSEYKQIDFEDISEQIESKKLQIDNLDAALLGANEALKPLIEARAKHLDLINDKKRALNQRITEYSSDYNAKTEAISKQLDSIDNDNERINELNQLLKQKQECAKSDLSLMNADLEANESRLKALRKENAEIKASVFNADKCASCGQELPYDQIEELKIKFNQNKQQKSEEIIKLGKSLAKRSEELKTAIANLIEAANNEVVLTPLKDKSELVKQLKVLGESFVPFSSTDEYVKLRDEITDLNNRIPEIEAVDTEKIASQKKQLMQDLEDLNRQYGMQGSIAKLESEIKQLQEEQRVQANQKASIEKLESEIKEYEREKAAIASDRINGNLQFCNIQTMEMQKDGNYKDSCTICDKEGIKYSTTNGASKILTMIDIQRMFCEKYDVSMPIWVDEASIINPESLPVFNDTQVIKLYREKCKLTIES